jgi:transcription-repair coupling factor (superfamily II helicase)
MSSASAPLSDAGKLSTALTNTPATAVGYALAQLQGGKIHPLPAPTRVLHVASSDRTMEHIAEQMAFYAPNVEVLLFPAWDTMPYDRASPNAGIMAARMRTLAALIGGPRKTQMQLVITTANAIIQALPPKEALNNVVFNIRKTEKLSIDALTHYLSDQGYRRTGKAIEPGEFVVRGGIIDIIPSGSEEGVRIDLFGDEIESLKLFDPLSQVTHGTIQELSLYPMGEVLLNEQSILRFRENYRELFGAISKEDPLYEAISQGQHYAGMEHWLPLFYAHTETLMDYLPDALITLEHDTPKAIEERHETILDYYNARTSALGHTKKKLMAGSGGLYQPVPPARAFTMKEDWTASLAMRDHLTFSHFHDEQGISAALRPAIRFVQGRSDNTPFDQLKEQLENCAAHGKNLLLACFSEGARERIQTLLLERGFHCVRVDKWSDQRQVKGKSLGLCVLPLEAGYETPQHLILSEQDVFGERIARTAKKKKQSSIFMQENANFNEGELVVHKDHGIGRFEGLITVTVSGAAHDCLKLIYAGDDKLFLPVENIEMISRYGLEDENVQLDKLGGASWQNRKARLKQRIKLAAEALLSIAAQRLFKKGTVIAPEHNSYEEFCARFPYNETEDQAKAIEDVLEDLYSGKPMDRLVCGDVGFGKTEVALRAAFAAVSSSDEKLQVALVCPTTLLARQHYRNFRDRFAGFPITVRQLSRMVTTKDQKETREGIADGTVDIVIGTHAVLAKQISFKKLGLVIIDEEQHFGVAQKEKLKELKSNVHVLTLSATPIPRTLQMALTGVRDLSLITTPPVDRLAVRSFVMPFDPVVIRESIMRELHRGGRCFIVTPRIKYIADLKWQLAELVPEAKLAVAHGQMPPSELDEVMNDFYDGKYDILLSTAIIESGLDIPTANTMIIHNAHLFGLAQLYQMRGRVGRGKIRAYAYFLLPHQRELTKNATKRLEVIQTLDTLGAGFTLASHDMDIRGFGNLVGEEQSGHIKEVGIELYQQMLEDAVAALKRDSKDSAELDEEWSPQINLGISVLIPESYVEDLQLRLGLYRRVASMDSEADINSFAAELVDRFGPVPEEVQHLISVLNMKLLCKQTGIERIDCGPKGAVLSFHLNSFAKPEALLTHVMKNPRTLKLRPDQKLVFSHEWAGDEQKLGVIKKELEQIAALLA